MPFVFNAFSDQKQRFSIILNVFPLGLIQLFSENEPVSEKSFNLSGRCILWFAKKTHSQGWCVSGAVGLLPLV